jgi:putative peptidoglycan lipid II flippase
LAEYSKTSAQQAVETTQAAGLIALGSIASRVLGVVREIVKAGLFGATGSVGALEVAIRVPSIIYELLVGGMVNSALVPVLSDYATPERRSELWRLLSAMLSVAVVVLSAFVLIGEVLAPQIVWLMAGGLDPALQAEATRLLRIMLPVILFLNAAGIVTGALYALKRFTYPAFTAAVFNAATVAAALLLGPRVGVASVALGVLAGAILQLVVQWPGLRDARLRLGLSVHHAALRRIGRLYIPIAIGLIVDMLGVALSYNLASRTGEQSIPWMQYSATLIQLPLGLVSIAVSIAILPTLSRQETGNQPKAFRATLAHGLRLILALTIPATVGLWVMATPIVALVFEHGTFGAADTVATVGALRFHLIGLIFAAVDQPLIFAFYARKDTWTPAIVGVVTVFLYVLMALVPVLFVPLTLNRLILANSLKWASHALIMLALLRRRMGSLGGHRVWGLVARASGASAAMGGIVFLALRLIGPAAPTGLLGEVLLVAGAGLAGALGYGALALLLRIEEVSLLVRAFADWARRLPRARPGTNPASATIRDPSAASVARAVQPPVDAQRYDEAYFLGACEGYEEFIATEGAHLSRRLRQAFEAAEIAPGMTVLDVGCGRGEILRRCAEKGVLAYGVDFAPVAIRMARDLAVRGADSGRAVGLYQADAKLLPFPDGLFDRVLMFDLVEHLHPWELDRALSDARRVLRPGGRLVVHTAPNVWYDRFAYPVVRLVRTLTGQGRRYPKNPRSIIPDNLDVHVNEQSVLSLRRSLARAGFRSRVWLYTPPPHRREGILFRLARRILFRWVPFRWFFEREVLAVAEGVR